MMRALVLVLAVAALAGCGGDDCSGVSYCEDHRCAGILLCDSAVTKKDAMPPCDLLAQTGCLVGQKCTWFIDSLMPSVSGHRGCAINGLQLYMEPCLFGMPGAMGHDNCVQGTVCSNARGELGTCKQICDLNPPSGHTVPCSAPRTCTAVPDLFVENGVPLAGVCELP